MKEIISQWQLMALVLNFILGTSIIFNFEVIYGHRDTWMAEILALVFGIFIVLSISNIVNKYPKQDVGEILENIFGKIIARLIMFQFVGFAVYLAALVLNNIKGIMNTMVMQQTPGWIFILSLSISTGIVVRYGVEVLARCVELITPFVLSLLFLLFILALYLVDFSNLTPVFAETVSDIIKSIIVSSSFPYAEGVLFIFIAVLVRKKNEVYIGTVGGLIISGIILILRPIYTIGVFGVEEAIDLIYPFYVLVRQINIGDFLERIELLYLLVWFFTSFIKLAVNMYVIAKGLQYIFNLEDYRKLALPIAVFLSPLAQLAFGNYQETLLFTVSSWPIITFSMVGTLILISVFALKKMKNKNNVTSS